MFGSEKQKRMMRLIEGAAGYIERNYEEPPREAETAAADGDILYCPEENRVGKADLSVRVEQTGTKYGMDNRGEGDSADDRSSSDGAGHRGSGSDNGIGDHYSSDRIRALLRDFTAGMEGTGLPRSLDDLTDMSFADRLLFHIRNKHLRPSEVYRAAQMDRRLFSKIVSDHTYKPGKDTCIALALALGLSLSEANDLLARAGYVLSHSCRRDVVLEYFFCERVYDINDINEVLYRLGEKGLGRL